MTTSFRYQFITPKLLIIGAIIIGILALVLVMVPTKPSGNVKMRVADTPIYVQVMRTPLELEQGLSGKEKLGEYEGMLFIMPQTQIPVFWMKDMRFDIDMIWIKDTTVVGVTEDVPMPKAGTPLSDLPRYSPTEPADKVLEVNAGFSQKHGIKKGSTVSIPTL